MKRIAVVGATGNQGGSVLKYLVESGRYKVRALTRDPTSSKALALKKYGDNVELWKCDMENSDELIRAFENCWGAYLMTDYWSDPARMETKEVEIGRRLIDAAIKANLKYAVWSSVKNVGILSEGRLHVPHFDNKALVEEYARTEFLNKNIQTKFAFVQPGCYMQNFLGFPGLRIILNKDGIVENEPMPINQDAQLALINIDELGKWVLPMFDEWERFINNDVYASNGYITMPEFLSIVAQKLNTTYIYRTCSYDEFFKRTGNVELTHMLQFFNEIGYYAGAQCDDFKSWTKNIMSVQDAIASLPWEATLKPSVSEKITNKIQETVGAVKDAVTSAFSSEKKDISSAE